MGHTANGCNSVEEVVVERSNEKQTSKRQNDKLWGTSRREKNEASLFCGDYFNLLKILNHMWEDASQSHEFIVILICSTSDRIQRVNQNCQWKPVAL